MLFQVQYSHFAKNSVHEDGPPRPCRFLIQYMSLVKKAGLEVDQNLCNQWVIFLLQRNFGLCQKETMSETKNIICQDKA